MKKSTIQPALALTLSSLLATTAAINAGVYTNNFDTGAAGLTIYTIAGNAPEVRTTNGNPGGYLKLTDAENSTTSTVLFPDLDGGLAVQAFNFKVDCRIGNGSAVPADGFSISFARPGDATLDDGIGFNSGAAEEGTPTGLSVSFDTYDNTSPTVVDYIGFQVKLDGVPIAGGDVPAATLNGAIDDATSLETGPIGSAGWAPFEVTLKTDGKLDVFWKNVRIITDLETGWTPSAGRIVFGARTGGLNAQHHFDNVSLTTTPAPQAAVTRATANSAGYTFQISDNGSSVVDPATGIDSIFIDGVPITPTSVTKTGGVITVAYTAPSALPARSSYTYEIIIRDTNTNVYTYTGSVTTPILPAGNLLSAVASTDFWNVTEVATGGLLSPFDIGRAADVFLAGAASSGFISTANYINFTDPQTNNQSGMFRYDQPFLSNTANPDDFLVQGSNFRMTVTGTTPEELQRSFWVRSDDGFALRIKGASFINKAGAGLIDPAASDTLTFLIGTGDSNTRGLCQFPVAGDYVVEFLYFEGDGGSYNELAVANGDFINNTNGTPWSLLGSPTLTPLLPAVLPATPVGAPAGQWNVREIRTADPAAYGNSLAGAIAFASGDLTGGTVTDGTSPVINFNDLDGAAALTALGFFNNDVPFLSNTAGDDNALIGVYRATINFTAGLHTIGAYADDGWAITVPGAWFVSNTGTGAFDPETSATMYDTNFNDAPTLGVLNVPVAGNYDVFYIAQEGIGGGGWEVFSAPGAFGTIGGTADWALIGNSAAIAAPTPIIPAGLPGPEGSDGLWGLRLVRDANASGSIFTALTAANAGTGTITDGTAPYLNFSDTDGGLGLFKEAAAVAAYQVAEVPYPASTGLNDNIIAVAKATIVIPPGEGGEWTFGVHSDDGFALKIDGAVYKRVSGANFIQPGLKNTAYFRFGTGDSDARIVMDIPEGTHDVEFIWFEGTGGSFFELYAAKGAFANDGDTDTWRLVGGAEGLTLVGAAPADPGFQISSIVPGPGAGEYTVTFPSVTGTSYSAEWNSVLNTPFAPISTITGAAGTETSFVVNPVALNGGPISRFFVRVRRN